MNALNRFSNLSSNGERLLNLGQQPVSNRFLKKSELAPHFPLTLRLDLNNGLVHQERPFPLEELVPRYPWLTCFEPETHLDEMVESIIKLCQLGVDSNLAAYSFKDDSTLERFRKLGFQNTWRLDMNADFGIDNPSANVETLQFHFTPNSVKKIVSNRSRPDVFIVRHVLEHSYRLDLFLEACRSLVRPGGYVVFEVPDCYSAFDLLDYTTIWEEHVFYFTSSSFGRVLREAGFKLLSLKSHSYPFENSLVAITQVLDNDFESVDDEPIEFDAIRRFATHFPQRKERVKQLIEASCAKNGPIALFGAGHLTMAFLSLFEVSEQVEFIVDDNPNKAGLRAPAGGLRIVPSIHLYEAGIKTCLLGVNPQNQNKIIQKHLRFIEGGGRFASIFPGSPMEMDGIL